VASVNTASGQEIWYSYEEFADNLKAMDMVRGWEFTNRFGHLGTAQTSQANNARILEYFSDCYIDRREAFRKAELFLSIHDYIGRNAVLFCTSKMLDEVGSDRYEVEPALLRAVHHAFTAPGLAENLVPHKVLSLAKAFDQFQRA
jgi:hypothetical protein